MIPLLFSYSYFDMNYRLLTNFYAFVDNIHDNKFMLNKKLWGYNMMFQNVLLP